MNLASGTKLGPYEIVSLLGAGGMGEVYRARDSRLRREVAIKVLPQALSLDAERMRRFEQEALATAALNHPNILAVFDIGTSDGSPYVVSELLEGETLRERLRSGSIATRKALDLALQIAHGLAAAHEKGIIHRDLKPENLFLTKDGRVKILDFGLAKLTQSEPGSAHTSMPTATQGTEAGVVMGTAGYMSPEQVRGMAVDARSDIFSFGAILYEMLSGKRAFHGETPADTMSSILKEDPAELSETNRKCFSGAGADCAALPGEESGGRGFIRRATLRLIWNIFPDFPAVRRGWRAGSGEPVESGAEAQSSAGTRGGVGDRRQRSRSGVVDGKRRRSGTASRISADYVSHRLDRQCPVYAGR